MVGNPAHGDLAFPVSGGERQLQLAARDNRVVIKKLVEVAHAEKQERVGILPFGG